MRTTQSYVVYVTRVASYRIEAESSDKAIDTVLEGNLFPEDEETVEVTAEQLIRRSGML